jgi:EF-P beta-lysylation protein EpmB
MQIFSVATPSQSPGDWRRELSEAVSDPRELLSLLDLEHALGDRVIGTPGFRLRVPMAYIAKMRKGDIDDPLLRQVLPLMDENSSDGVADPVGDLDAMPVPGLLHKYHGRVLLLTTGACAVHCRYCFRRHFPYGDANPARSEWRQALDYLRDRDDITEIILSGGDPLVLDNAKLGELLQQLEQIPHLKWLRIHTRLPVVLPARIDAPLLQLLNRSRFRITMVIHANHANELTSIEATALRALSESGVTLLNQSVLLKGVNDRVDALESLSKSLYEVSVLPYYLHLLDPVRGAMHFDVPRHRASSLHAQLQTRLPGYLVPRLVQEIAGAGSKTAIFAI